MWPWRETGPWHLIDQDRALVFSDGVQFLCELWVSVSAYLAALIALLIRCFTGPGFLEAQGAVQGFRPRLLYPASLADHRDGLRGCRSCCLESFYPVVQGPFLMLSWVCVMARCPFFA
jgi:hypothetical protein